MKKKSLGSVLVILLLVCACSKWKVSKLKNNKLFFVPNGKTAGSLLLNFNKNETLDLSFSFSISNDRVFAVDNNQKILQVFDKDGNLSLVIGQKPLAPLKISNNLKKEDKNLTFINSLIRQIKDEKAKEELVKIQDDVKSGKVKELAELKNLLKAINNKDINGLLDAEISNSERDMDYRFKPFSFGIIGNVISSSNDRIFIQNRIISSAKPTRRRKKKKNLASEMDITPSYILVFDKKGNLEYTLGQNGKADIPFYYIENMVSDIKNRLFVISKNYNTWSVYRFNNKKRDVFIKFPDDMFKEQDGKKTYHGVIENIDVFNSGNRLLLSIAYYDKTRFKYRKIVEYSVESQSAVKTILEIPEPKNELFKILGDKYILLWNVDGQNVRFTIWNFQGNIVNTLKIVLDQKKSLYGDIIMDRNGKFYTYLVFKNGVELQEWN